MFFVQGQCPFTLSQRWFCLQHRVADSSFKVWLDFKGKLLFGANLEKLVKDLSETQSYHLPEDRAKGHVMGAGASFSSACAHPLQATDMTPGDLRTFVITNLDSLFSPLLPDFEFALTPFVGPVCPRTPCPPELDPPRLHNEGFGAHSMVPQVGHRLHLFFSEMGPCH